MGMFVRQKLLSALGIDGQAPASPSTDIEPVIGELKRLHTELKEFVAESLAMYSSEFGTIQIQIDPGFDPSEAPGADVMAFSVSDPDENADCDPQQDIETTNTNPPFTTEAHRDEELAPPSVPDELSHEAPAPTYSAAQTDPEPASDESPDEASADDESSDPVAAFQDSMEGLANKTFAISPRLGPIGKGGLKNFVFPTYRPDTEQSPHAPDPAPGTDQSTEDPGPDLSPDPRSEQPSSTPAVNPTATKPPPAQTSAQNPSSNSAPTSPSTPKSVSPTNAAQSPSPKPASIPAPAQTSSQSAIPAPQKPGQPLPPLTKAPFTGKHTDSNTSGNNPHTQAKRDPLADLLDPSDLASSKAKPSQPALKAELEGEEEEDDETFDIPLAILARRKQMEEENQTAPEEQNLSQSQTAPSSVNSDPPLISKKPTHRRARPEEKPESELSSDSDSNSSAQAREPKLALPQSDTDNQTGTPPLDNRDDQDPFSGGPPPKKRQ